MKQKILIAGCSFSTDKPNVKSWSSYFDETKFEVTNIAKDGSGNLVIRRSVEEMLEKEKFDYCIIQWSTIDRWDYPSTFGGEMGNSIRYYYNGSNPKDGRRHFYNNYYSRYGALIDTLENILFLQSTLKKYDIPYVMFSLANLEELDLDLKIFNKILSSNGNYNEIKINNVLDTLENTGEYPNNLKFLLKSIDYSKFKFSTPINKYFGGGMIEWINLNNLKLNKEYNYHPSTEQNQLFFNHYIQTIFI
jgi:hypothetical protein